MFFCEDGVGPRATRAGAPSIKKFFKTDGADIACRVGVPHLRACFFKTDGVRNACKAGAPRLRTWFIQI